MPWIKLNKVIFVCIQMSRSSCIFRQFRTLNRLYRRQTWLSWNPLNHQVRTTFCVGHSNVSALLDFNTDYEHEWFGTHRRRRSLLFDANASLFSSLSVSFTFWDTIPFSFITERALTDLITWFLVRLCCWIIQNTPIPCSLRNSVKRSSFALSLPFFTHAFS